MSITYFNRFGDGDDLSALDAAFMAALRDGRDKLVGNLMGVAAAQYNVTPEPYGGFRRTLAGVWAIPASASAVYTLDDSVDWRDRMLLICSPLAITAVAAFYPGHEDDKEANTKSASGLGQWRCYYTGSGYADPGGSPSNNCHKLFASDDLQLYVSTGGELRIEVTSTLGAGQFAMMGMVFAGPKMNARAASVGTTYVSNAALYDAADGAQVEPHDLNNVQDGVHVEQMQSEDSFALGPIGRGDSLLPYEWTVRGETRRQRLLEPALRRYVSGTLVADETIVLDRSFDWRDRFVWASGMFSITVDRRPGEAGDSGSGSFNQADCEATAFTGYTGDGDTDANHASGTEPRYTLRQLATLPSTPVFLYAGVDDGYLYASTKDSSPVACLTLDLFIMASPRVGPRSKGIGPDKLETDLPAKKVVGTLVDSANTDLTNIVARYRMDRGLVLDGGKVAVIADQSGNGHHLRQLDPALRAPAPLVRVSLGQECIGFTGVEYYETVKALPASVAGYFVAMILEPTASLATFEPWSAQLPVSTEGDIVGRIVGTQVDGEWVPNATATPPFKHSQVSGTYAAGVGLGIGWNFVVDADPTRLAPELSVRRVGGSAVAGALVSTSPAGVGAADVQALVWRLLEGFRGYVAEVIVCSAGQAAADDFHTSADIVSRYSF